MLKKIPLLSLLAFVLIITTVFAFANFKKNNNFDVPYMPKLTIDYKSEEIHRNYKFEVSNIFDGIVEPPLKGFNSWSLLVGGDVMVGRTVNYKTLSYNNFNWPYEKISHLLSSADYTFINLESPVISDCPVTNSGMLFCGHIDHIRALKTSGVDMASLLNNHTLNKGVDGLNQTIDQLNLNGVNFTGINNPTLIFIKGVKVAFLSYTDVECYSGVACADHDAIKSDIQKAKAEYAQVIIIMFHWGAEYRDYPISRQIELAHFSIDEGADLVLGNHPHWIQPFELYKDKLIMYSHGNLVFDQMWSEKTREGLLAKYVFSGNKLVDVELFPVYIEDYGQPRLMEGPEKSRKIEFIESITSNHSILD